ncbi:glycoside hydrolase family 3 C-terminal domain-containing protein [Luteimicrobium subarcticum]|uniref:Exo-alpha-(1->6)-L-arabinopyranosidase n=1 Tax=Luteimicrobium subarcticum TaxID=620910 RepID=A0A2M8WJ18_9MICO|nr:glycoside hydrolase family 3 C-terminal domain-containing protein [Luteimicrobium subarcticum]PJI90925.1 beta-glucosidase [Luteimicrobium subarcticum]
MTTTSTPAPEPAQPTQPTLPEPGLPALAHPDLVGRLTLEQKASLVSGADVWHTQGIEEHGIASIMVTDGPHGLRKAGSGDEIGIGTSNPATCFPPAVTLGSTWNVDLARRVGEAIGDEARAEQVGVVLGPGVNIKRSPLCGRNFEYVSEDPHVAGRIGAGLVEGIQSRGIGTSLKHFAANNQETDRMRVSADVDERTLREIYLPAFEHVVTTQQPTTVMCAYNAVNGVPASQNHWLLTEVLRGDWGFEGLVVSDWGAVWEPDAAVAAGLELEMPPSGGESVVVDAVREGRLDEAVLDVAVDRVLTLLDRTRDALAADDPALDDDAYARHHEIAREAAREGAVLLENDGVLPLDAASAERIAVVGAFAAEPRYQGAGSSQVVPTRVDDALTAIRAAAGADRVTYAAGFRLDGQPDAALHDEAVAAARAADVTVLFVGLPSVDESEGYDRTHIDLADVQVDLIDALQGVTERLVVVLSNGSVVAVDAWRDGCAAILEGWLLGQAGGSATADLLFGVVSPSGRLTETVPVRLSDTPSYLSFPGSDGHVVYGEGLYVGYRYFDTLGKRVSYPFGHGLTYTTFEYGEPVAVPAPDRGAHAWDVHVSLTNTGDVPASEVVQVYVHDEVARVARPSHELRGFAKVPVEPGETVEVVVPLDERAFAFWSVRDHRWEVEAGRFVIEVGASSHDIRGTVVVEAEGDGFRPLLTDRSTMGEWIDDPVGAQVLGAAMAAAGGGQALPADDDPVAVFMRQMPLAKIATFVPGVTRENIAQLVAGYAAAR